MNIQWIQKGQGKNLLNSNPEIRVHLGRITVNYPAVRLVGEPSHIAVGFVPNGGEKVYCYVQARDGSNPAEDRKTTAPVGATISRRVTEFPLVDGRYRMQRVPMQDDVAVAELALA